MTTPAVDMLLPCFHGINMFLKTFAFEDSGLQIGLFQHFQIHFDLCNLIFNVLRIFSRLQNVTMTSHLVRQGSSSFLGTMSPHQQVGIQDI